MKNLVEYVTENRCDSIAKIEDGGWWGEIFISTKSLFYDVPTKAGNKKVFAFISRPKTPKPKNGYPAVLLIHGGNGQAFYEMTNLWAERGFVTIAPDFNGKMGKNINERAVANPDGGNAGYGSFDDLHDENPWAFFSVLSAMRGIDVLMQDADVDKNNVFSCGLSWGGFVQLLLSSVDSRIKASSVIYSSAYIQQSKWGENKFLNVSQDDKDLWLKTIAPENYLENIKSPVFFTAGADDIAFTMENRRKTAEKISSKCYFGLRKSFPHGNFWGFEQKESAEFFNSIKSGKEVISPSISRKNGKITAIASVKNSNLAVCYTNESLIDEDCQTWQEEKIVSKKSFTLSSDVTAFFITETTKDGLCFSSDLFKI